MARNKEVVGGEQKLKSHWARCGSSGEAQWSNHFPRNGLGQLPSRWIEVREDTLAKSLHSPLRDRPWDCPCCLRNAFCETAKTTPNKRAHLPQMFAQLLNTARNPWASRNRDCYSIPAWVGVRGWGDAGYTADFYLDTLISGLLRDKRCLRYC